MSANDVVAALKRQHLRDHRPSTPTPADLERIRNAARRLRERDKP